MPNYVYILGQENFKASQVQGWILHLVAIQPICYFP